MYVGRDAKRATWWRRRRSSPSAGSSLGDMGTTGARSLTSSRHLAGRVLPPPVGCPLRLRGGGGVWPPAGQYSSSMPAPRRQKSPSGPYRPAWPVPACAGGRARSARRVPRSLGTCWTRTPRYYVCAVLVMFGARWRETGKVYSSEHAHVKHLSDRRY